MNGLSRAQQRPGPAPTSVNEVLRQPGRPLRRSVEGQSEGQYQPAIPSGRHLLAHELVHVAQGAAGSADLLHRFEAPEHQDFGDRGLVDLAAFLQTREGAEFGEKLGGTTALQDLRRDPFFQGKKFRVHDVELTVGDIIAMAGDFYPSLADLVPIPLSCGRSATPFAKSAKASSRGKSRTGEG